MPWTWYYGPEGESLTASPGAKFAVPQKALGAYQRYKGEIRRFLEETDEPADETEAKWQALWKPYDQLPEEAKEEFREKARQISRMLKEKYLWEIYL